LKGENKIADIWLFVFVHTKICVWLFSLPILCRAFPSIEFYGRGGRTIHHFTTSPIRSTTTPTTMASKAKEEEEGEPQPFFNSSRIHYSPFLKDDDKHHFDVSTTAMVILNSPIRRPPSPLFDILWTKSSFHVCADGGANRLYRATRKLDESSTATAQNDTTTPDYVPDLITGDLDSLQNATREYYEKMNVPIVQQYDQDYNDLDKSIRSIPAQYQTCFVYGAFGGRFDQEMASIQGLFNYLDKVDQIWLFNDQNAAILLLPGQDHSIYCPNHGDDDKKVLGEGPTCGLIPIGHRCEMVTTGGLRWNLRDDALEFGGLVSTSNRIVEHRVQIKCSHPLLFTVEVEAGIDEETW